MEIRRLGWAGIEIEAASGEVAVIDLLEDLSAEARFIGEPHTELPPARPGAASLALVTHLHSDHTDGAAIARALTPDGVVLRPAPMHGPLLEAGGTLVGETSLREHKLATRVVVPWETVTVGAFTVTAIPAVDGFGDEQVSWVVEADGTRILHAGDTLFHGWWWRTVLRLGAIDVAFLPINAAVVSLPHRQPASRLEAVMGPREAVEAAHALKARLAVPIHYDTISRPPVYVQGERPAETFAALAEEHGVPARVVGIGERVPMPVAASA